MDVCLGSLAYLLKLPDRGCSDSIVVLVVLWKWCKWYCCGSFGAANCCGGRDGGGVVVVVSTDVAVVFIIVVMIVVLSWL